MRPIPLRLLVLLVPPMTVMAGCSGFLPERQVDCGGNTDYLQAVERPPLNLPPEIVPSERLQPLAIPAIDPAPATLDPVPRCLDQPPKFFARKAGASADTVEDAVKLWAWAWASRKPDVVLQMYSPNFQAPGVTGSAAYLDALEEQVAAGPAAEPRVENLSVTASGAERRVVTFTQRVGDQEVRREQTLVREGGIWRIVAERTL